MQVYRINLSNEQRGASWHNDRGEGHKELTMHAANPDARLELVDLSVDKDNVLAILNGGGAFKLIKTWALTDRGGLKEVANGE